MLLNNTDYHSDIDNKKEKRNPSQQEVIVIQLEI